METDKLNKAGKSKSGFIGALSTFLVVVRGLILNPVGELAITVGTSSHLFSISVSMTILGIVSNFSFGGQLPDIILKFLNSIGSSFSSLAPFTLGLGMYGKLGDIKADRLMPIVALVLQKTFFTPILTYYMVGSLIFKEAVQRLDKLRFFNSKFYQEFDGFNIFLAKINPIGVRGILK